MRDTIWDRKVQKFVFSDGQAKGMRIVLQEHRVDTSRMKAVDMRVVLGNHADFKNEKTALEHFTQENDTVLYSSPSSRSHRFLVLLQPMASPRLSSKKLGRIKRAASSSRPG